MCSCGGVLTRTSYSHVCMECGRETKSFDPQFFLPGYNQSHAILRHSSTYSRRYRFHSLLLKTVLFHSGPAREDRIWYYLETQRPFHCVKDIQLALSKTNHKQKRYDCLGIFCKVFLPQVVIPRVTSAQIEQAMALFDSVLERWRTTRVSRFFSYFYLLEVILQRIGAGACMKTCKRLICKHRRAFYKEMLKRLGGLTTRPKYDWDKTSFLELVRHPGGRLAPKKIPQSAPVVSESSLRVCVGTLSACGVLSSGRRCGEDPVCGLLRLATSALYGRPPPIRRVFCPFR